MFIGGGKCEDISGADSGTFNPVSELVEFIERFERIIRRSDSLAGEIEEPTVGARRFRIVIHCLVDGGVLHPAECPCDEESRGDFFHGIELRISFCCFIDVVPLVEDIFRPVESCFPELLCDVFRMRDEFVQIGCIQMP